MQNYMYVQVTIHLIINANQQMKCSHAFSCSCVEGLYLGLGVWRALFRLSMWKALFRVRYVEGFI